MQPTPGLSPRETPYPANLNRPPDRTLPGPLAAERSVGLRHEYSLDRILHRCLQALDDQAAMAAPQSYAQQRALDAANRLREELRDLLS